MKEVINYLALGDSITEAANSYVNDVAALLATKCTQQNTVNLGVSGCQSGHMVTALTDETNEAYESVRQAILLADVITLDIGSNDIFVTAIGVFCEYFNCAPEELGATMEGWINKVQNETNIFKKYVYYQQASAIARNIHTKLYDSDLMPGVVENYRNNFKTIISIIEELNPDVELRVGNLYNPYYGFEPLLFADGFEIVDLDEFSKTYVGQFNDIIDEVIGDKHPVVDIDAAFVDSTYINADPATGNYDPHPTEEGQRVIGKLFVETF